jgi:hypothetical protein
MAFAMAITKKDVMGSHRVAMGTFSQASGDTGGAFVTGLRKIEYFESTAALTMSVSGGTATVTTANPGGAQAGFWKAIGY